MATLKTVPAGGLTGSALWALSQMRVARWNRAARSREALERLQLDCLFRNVRAAASTEFGRAHGFGNIRSYAEFKDRVPLRSYAELETYLERMRQGERDVLWPGLVRYYGQSSGSSNTEARHKFLPISDAQIRWQQKAGFDVLARYVSLTGDREITSGYTLGLFPPAILKPSGPVYITNNPGLMQRHVPFPASRLTLPKQPIRDIENYEQKLNRIAESYLDYDVRAISGTSCWFSILFEKVLAAASAQGRRAETVSDIWPNLRVLFGGGVHAEPYRRVIDNLMGRSLVLMDNYNATEGGLFAVTDRLTSRQGGSDPGMLMIPDRGVFFEFIPKEQHGKPGARRLALWEVEPGVEYSVALSTSSGLFGYYIGDSIRFVSTLPHRMEFTGRMSGVLSLTQELTSYIEIERAVAEAATTEPCTIVEFAASTQVGVDDGPKGRYVLFVEFDRDPADLGKFTAAFDHGLSGQNRVYREHRIQDVAILPPQVVPLHRGASSRFLRETGATSVQHKFPRIVDDHRREILMSLARSASGHADP